MPDAHTWRVDTIPTTSELCEQCHEERQELEAVSTEMLRWCVGCTIWKKVQ